jgi:excisionase family DNA binding protein
MTCIGGMMDEFMTPNNVAELLHLHLKTVYKLAKKGELPGSRIGRSWRFRRSDVEALVAHKEKAA